MELLIYNTDHWFDLESSERKAELNKDGKYDSRYKKGDIIEVREDGYWTGKNGKGYNNSIYYRTSRNLNF